MPECKDCGDERKPLLPDGRCNFCVSMDGDEPYRLEERGDFKYETDGGDSLPTYICVKCGADKFIVGRVGYHTAIKCVACQWERCIHDG